MRVPRSLPPRRLASAFVDVFVDPAGKPLAAYQLELRTTEADAQLVGIEGGEHKAFAHHPYYDPKALLEDRVVLAALDAGKDLPSGKTARRPG
jgi:hypothetical protein